jgi:uncharacterized protein (DUF58 family)
VIPSSSTARWAPTHAHVRAVLVAVLAIAVAVIGTRPDLAVLAVPFIGAAAWGTARRPRRGPSATTSLGATTLFEGQWTNARIAVRDGDAGEGAAADAAEVVAVAFATTPWLATDPRSGTVAAVADGGDADLVIPVRALRWGRHEARLERVVCASALGAYRTELVGNPIGVTTLPLSAEFDAADVVPRPAGLVGLHRANRQGSGSEPAEVRPFRPGDRLRRINWKVSSRTGALHVTSTWADQDTHVLLLLDTEADIGVSDGIDGRASSLDIAVRAAAAIGEHYLRAGDRVGLIDLGRRVRDIRAGSGRRHLRRLIDALVVAEPGAINRPELLRIRPIEAGAMVIALTPLVGRAGPEQVVSLVQHGHTVVVVDTLPPPAKTGASPWERMAVRVRAMERQAEIDALNELGVPVVPWRGRGTLDEVLRDASRVAAAPRRR